MLKIYLSDYNEGKYNVIYELIDNLKQKLINTSEVIVFQNGVNKKKDETICEINNLKVNLNLWIGFCDSGDKKMLRLYCKEQDEISNGYGKEILKKLKEVYDDENNLYDLEEEIVLSKKITSSLVYISFLNSDKNSQVIKENVDLIAEKIALGIINGSKLKPC